MIRRLCTLMLVLVSTLPAGEGPRPPPLVETKHNSALQYWIAFAHLAPNIPDWLVAMSKQPVAVASPHAEQANSPVLAYLHLGAACAGGTFDSVVGMEQMGYGSSYPYLASCRMVSQLALARAAWRFQHHQQAAAIEDCLAVLALATDLGNDGSVLETLVALRCEVMAMQRLALYLPDCTATERADLVTKLADFRHQRQRSGLIRGEQLKLSHYIQQPDVSVNQLPKLDMRDGVDMSGPLVAAATARDKRLPVWISELSTSLQPYLAMTELTGAQYTEKRSQHIDGGPGDNPVLRHSLPHIAVLIDHLRNVAIMRYVLIRAAKQLNETMDLTALEGIVTLDGPLTVTKLGPVTTLRVVRPSDREARENVGPVELIIGHDVLPPLRSIEENSAVGKPAKGR